MINLRTISNICFSIGAWFVLNGLGIELNLLFPLGLSMVIEGIRIKKEF